MHSSVLMCGLKCGFNNSAVGPKLRSTKLTAAMRAALTLAVISALLLAAVQPAHGQRETVLYSFADSPDGWNPFYVTPVLDKKGNLYGTTVYGGAYDGGAVFKLVPSGTETILYSFGGNGDGSYPFAGLVLDKKGNLYGTTYYGGNSSCQYGCGVVFEVTPSGTETTLHSFDQNGTDGYYPVDTLAFDKTGNLYGTTYGGGAYGGGTVFKLTPSGTETILYSFGVNGADAYHPVAGVALGKKGNLYGTTYQGGAYNWGTVFKVTPSGTETILHSFDANGADGYHPYAVPVFDKKGNLYGTTYYGGAYDGGTVFEVTPKGKETILYSFNLNGTDGLNPNGVLVFDKEGNLYGTTCNGGNSSCAYSGCGVVFELTPSGTETILHSFGPYASGDGLTPFGGLVFDKEGNLYGTTSVGGAYNDGTVYKVTP